MFVIHSIPGSPFGRAVIAALIEKDQPWRLVPVAPGETKQPAHLARQPFGRVPAVEHDGFELYETQAILRYIDQVFPTPPLTPADAKAAARMNQLIGINDWYFFRPTSGVGVVFNRVIAPRIGMQGDEAAAAAAVGETGRCLQVLDGLLGDQPYLAGETLSLADLHIGPQLDLLSECAEGRELLAKTRLPAWLDRLRARPSFQRTTWALLAEAA